VEFRYLVFTRMPGDSYKRYTPDVPLVEFMYLVFTHMPGESYRRRLRSLLLYLCYVFRALVNSPVSWFCTSTLYLVLFQIRIFGCSVVRLSVYTSTWQCEPGVNHAFSGRSVMPWYSSGTIKESESRRLGHTSGKQLVTVLEVVSTWRCEWAGLA